MKQTEDDMMRICWFISQGYANSWNESEKC